jgi:hypothetical protein
MPIWNSQLQTNVTDLWVFSKLLPANRSVANENSSLEVYGITVSSLDCILQFGYVEAPLIQEVTPEAFPPGSLDRTVEKRNGPGPPCPWEFAHSF